MRRRSHNMTVICSSVGLSSHSRVVCRRDEIQLGYHEERRHCVAAIFTTAEQKRARSALMLNPFSITRFQSYCIKTQRSYVLVSILLVANHPASAKPEQALRLCPIWKSNANLTAACTLVYTPSLRTYISENFKISEIFCVGGPVRHLPLRLSASF